MLNDWSDRPTAERRRPFILSSEFAVVVLVEIVAGVVAWVRG